METIHTRIVEVEQEIEKYPALQDVWSKNKSLPSFEQVVQQLEWCAGNLRELRRCLHRLHCLLTDTDGLFTNLDETQVASLAALTIIDACKLAPKSIEAFGTGYKKDSVEFFFQTLRERPEIYPVFNALSKEAQNYIKENLPEYFHMRHLQLGEVPAETIKPFLKEAQEKPESLTLMGYFWLVNLTGFDPVPEGKNPANHGSTASETRLNCFKELESVLVECVKQNSTISLTNYYASKIPQSIKTKFANCDDCMKSFVARLSMLASDKLPENVVGQLLENTDYNLLEQVSRLENFAYKKLSLTAITFLPAVFWKLGQLDSKLDNVLKTYLVLQKKLFEWIANSTEIEGTLGINRSIPLFSISQNSDFLEKLSKDHTADCNWDLDMSGKFASVLVTTAAASKPKKTPYHSPLFPPAGETNPDARVPGSTSTPPRP